VGSANGAPASNSSPRRKIRLATCYHHNVDAIHLVAGPPLPRRGASGGVRARLRLSPRAFRWIARRTIPIRRLRASVKKCAGSPAAQRTPQGGRWATRSLERPRRLRRVLYPVSPASRTDLGHQRLRSRSTRSGAAGQHAVPGGRSAVSEGHAHPHDRPSAPSRLLRAALRTTVVTHHVLRENGQLRTTSSSSGTSTDGR
jgi:hypothetical protein